MNIALANESFSPQFDGVAVCTQNYAKIINEKYGKSYVIVPGDKSRDVESFPYPIIEYPSSKPIIADQYTIGLPISYKLNKKLSEIPVDLIHSHCPFVSGILAQRIAKKRGLPHVSTFHSKFKDDVNQRIKINFNLPGELVAKYVAAFYERCDYVWTVSSGTANTLREYGYKGEILVMPNGCDMPVTHSDPSVRQAIADEYGLKADKPIFLFVGRMNYLKNINLIVKALGALKRRNKEFSMLFVGSGEDKAKLEALVAKLNLQNDVKFAGKVMDREKLRKIYASSDLFVFPSVYDNAPLVVREAAACGCASLLIKGSNSSEGVTDGFNGILTEERVSDIALGLSDAISKYDLELMGKNARDTIYMSWDDVLEKVVAEYEKILDEWSSKSHEKRKLNPLDQIDLLKEFNLKRSYQNYKQKRRDLAEKNQLK
ncbi:MAG: glycosyltransferase [Eubacteriales bacterium]